MAQRKSKGRKARRRSGLRLLSFRSGIVLAVVLVLWGFAGEWYVHHSNRWLAQKRQAWTPLVDETLRLLGDPLADLTDGLGLTGHDAIYDYDLPAPAGKVLFAGAPLRTGAPAPKDIRMIDRGEFLIGWSDTLRHPVWCAYHVVPKATFPTGDRPGFSRDREVPAAPRPDAYKNSGYDRGHMVPNYAIVTRYGTDAQRSTFLMSNIAPQTASLNRGVWREIELRIADLWTARYGEIWVVVGCISPQRENPETLPGTDVDVPTQFYQVVIAQEGLQVRAFAVLFDQQTDWRDWPARHLITIDELESLTGLDFNPGLPAFIQDPLESELPSRLWPVRPLDTIDQFLIRYQ